MARPKPQRLNPAADLTGKSRHAGAQRQPGQGPARGASSPKAPSRDRRHGRRLGLGSETAHPAVAIAPVASARGRASSRSPTGPWHREGHCWPSWSRSRCRSASTTPTTTPTACAATDEHRVGPARLTGLRRRKPKQVLAVALSFFALAAPPASRSRSVTGQWWLLAVGAVAIVAAWFYTGGKRPYGYYGSASSSSSSSSSRRDRGFGVRAGAQRQPRGLVGGRRSGLIACAVCSWPTTCASGARQGRGQRHPRRARRPARGTILFAVFMLVPFAIAVFFALFYPTAWLVMFALSRRCRVASSCSRRRPLES
ncbi:hypothetical protein ACFFRL_19625 [Agromyces hippuratus]|uniref:hypothetical protein n=1 Tax=Agromyces hippuratus TaxID=286438 RepID=UPI0035EE10F9